jgi:hypothetical protein
VTTPDRPTETENPDGSVTLRWDLPSEAYDRLEQLRVLLGEPTIEAALRRALQWYIERHAQEETPDAD